MQWPTPTQSPSMPHCRSRALPSSDSNSSFARLIQQLPLSLIHILKKHTYKKALPQARQSFLCTEGSFAHDQAHRTIAVSYTHLDVYKRQVYDPAARTVQKVLGGVAGASGLALSRDGSTLFVADLGLSLIHI